MKDVGVITLAGWSEEASLTPQHLLKTQGSQENRDGRSQGEARERPRQAPPPYHLRDPVQPPTARLLAATGGLEPCLVHP